ncbi:glutaminyl-peptide cyclotransferase [Desulfovibrio sp. OttesenSCG-928-A18]|nr:glutaminyl-peptide cyclotransferase [Desulfovibrio sp. OttesenSCG-928-A18]
MLCLFLRAGRPRLLLVPLFCLLLPLVFAPGPFAQAAEKDGKAQKAPVFTLLPLYSLPHNPGHSTQGLFFHLDKLYESTGGYGTSVIACKDPQSGETLRERALPPDYFGEGAVVAQGTLYLLTWKNRVCLMLHPDTLAEKDRFGYPGEGWGLAYDGSSLIRSDGSSFLYFHDLGGTVLGKLQVRDGADAVEGLNELEWIPGQGLLLANIWRTSDIVAIDLKSGSVRFRLNLEGLVPAEFAAAHVANGIALSPDGSELWITGKCWPRIFVAAWPIEGAPQ